MKSWSNLKRGVGCLFWSITFVTGLLIGYFLFWTDDQMTPYVNKQTAMRYALDYAQELCSREYHPRPINCLHYRALTSDENTGGWSFYLISADHQRAVDMLVDRKGKVEAEAEVDMDRPNTWPDGNRPTLPDNAYLHLPR